MKNLLTKGIISHIRAFSRNTDFDLQNNQNESFGRPPKVGPPYKGKGPPRVGGIGKVNQSIPYGYNVLPKPSTTVMTDKPIPWTPMTLPSFNQTQSFPLQSYMVKEMENNPAPSSFSSLSKASPLGNDKSKKNQKNQKNQKKYQLIMIVKMKKIMIVKMKMKKNLNQKDKEMWKWKRKMKCP